MVASRSTPRRSWGSRDVDELTRLLEHQCRCLDRVRYRTTVALHLLRAGETRFLPASADEIQAAVDELSHAELLRATVVADLEAELDVADHELTLEGIIRRSAPGIALRLRDLQQRLRAGLTELHELTGTSTAVAASELESIRRSLGRWSGTAHVPDGYVVASPVAPSRFDGSL